MDIEEATKVQINKTKPKLACPPTQRAKNIFAPSILHKDNRGQQPRFTFSTYMFTCKHKCKYSFCCIVSRCGKVFNSVRNLNSHHLCKH